MFKSFLIKYAEIGVKGKNRYLFENALVDNAKRALDKIDGNFKVTKENGRIYAIAEGDYDFDEAVEILDVQVVGLPQILDMLLRHDAGILPALLQLAELVERMVERLVRIDQLLQLLDDRLLDLEIRLLLGFEVGDERVAAAAVLLEQVFEPKFLRIGSRHELRFVAAGFDKSPALRLDLGAVRLVEGYLDGFHHPAQRQADLLQPAGKAPHGQVERRQHQHQHARRQKRLLVAANGLPVELQGLILALAEQRAGRPDKKAGKGVLKHAVHHHLQQEQARQPGDEGARHYEQEHFQF